MSAFNECDLIKWDRFINGEYNEVLNSATFKSRSKSKEHNFKTCDLIITADTETSHSFPGSTGEEAFYFEAPELEYLKGQKVYVPEFVKRNITNYADFKKDCFGIGLYLTDRSSAIGIHELYDELRRLYGWDDTLIDPADQIQDIYNFLDSEYDKKRKFEAEPEQFEVGWVYQWAVCIWDRKNRPVIVYGRKPTEMMLTFRHISDTLRLDSDTEALVYFHNFSYDYQYLKRYILKYINIDNDSDTQMLATGAHKIIQYKTNSGITFRCSYRLSNASLDFWSRNMVFTKHKKLVGAVDYKQVHYQDTPLTKDDWRYMFYDVLVDAECIDKVLTQDKDSLARIPLTSTGYVRRDTRKRYKKDKTALKEFRRCRMSEASFKVIRASQFGGYTHASRFKHGQTIKGTIGHRDMRSFYPSIQRMRGKTVFPIGKFIKYAVKPDKALTKRMFNDKAHCYIYVIWVKNVKLKPGIPFPTISEYQANRNKAGTVTIVADNGRVLETIGDGVILTLTDLDCKMMFHLYDIKEYQVLEAWRSRAGYLPAWLTDTVDQYYHDKAHYKALTKKEENSTYEAMLMKSKNRLNGIYGMTATCPVRDSWEEDPETGDWKAKPVNIAEELDKFYENKKNFMWLQWGSWTTAWSRYILLQYAEIIGWDNCLYCDTDSMFYISTPELEEKLDRIAEKNEQEAIKAGAYIQTEDGKIITYNSFDPEKDHLKITEFRALHSKCYAFICEGKLKSTIAGVNAAYRDAELGDIENLKHGMTFHKAGGTRVFYDESPLTTEDIDGHMIEHGGAAIIYQSIKTIKFEPWEFPEDKKVSKSEMTLNGRLIR